MKVEVLDSFPRPEEIVQISDGILADLENNFLFPLIPDGTSSQSYLASGGKQCIPKPLKQYQNG